MNDEGIYLAEVPEAVDSQQELEEEYDFVRAFHGTSSRFQDSVSEYGIIPAEEGVTLEKSKSNDPIVFFGPYDSEEADEMGVPSIEIYSDAESYAQRATGQHFGGKSLIVQADLPVENLVPDDVSKVDGRGVETAYDSIVEYAVVGHEGIVEPEIQTSMEFEGNPRPPVNNQRWSKSDEYREFFDALQEQDVETADEIAQRFTSQIDFMEHAEVLEEDLTPNRVMEREHPEAFTK